MQVPVRLITLKSVGQPLFFVIRVADLLPPHEVSPVTKETSQHPQSEETAQPDEAGRGSQSADRDCREPLDVEAAREAVRQAKEQFKDARRAYWHARREAVDQLKQIREMSVGDVVDETLKQVKRYPGPSVLIAALVGFFLGRLFRR